MPAAWSRTAAAAASIAPGSTAGHSMWAFKGTKQLGESAESESVQLRARRAVLHVMMKLWEFSVLEARMLEIEERRRPRTGAAPCSVEKPRRTADAKMARQIRPMFTISSRVISRGRSVALLGTQTV